ncbi:hypothetical protein JXA85_08215 [Candidatus Woesearchaeota archaeon]|nr:hypothetical protein [Candidatus Woesearchaeota archaeon]
MAVKKSIFLLAFFITAFLFVAMLLMSSFFYNERQDYIDTEMQNMYNSFNEMQVFMMMAETYGDEMACLAFQSRLAGMDREIWDLGLKIDRYRQSSEEFQKDPYYKEQKKLFNENEVVYLMLLNKVREKCSLNQTVLLFFYKNSEVCSKCDDQSFVLTDINKEIDEEISIFSFDTELNITAIDLLVKYYEIDEYPCIVLENNKFCGMLAKKFIMNRICEVSPWTSSCKDETD